MQIGEFEIPNGNTLTRFRVYSEVDFCAGMGGATLGSMYGFIGSSEPPHNYNQTTTAQTEQAPQANNPIAIHTAEGVAAGAVILAGLSLSVRYASYRLRTRKIIQKALEGFNQELEAGLYRS